MEVIIRLFCGISLFIIGVFIGVCAGRDYQKQFVQNVKEDNI